MAFLFLQNTIVTAQSLVLSENDLLTKINIATTDTAKATLHGKLAWLLKISKPEMAVEHANKELQIGYTYNDPTLLADAYKTKGLLLVIQKKYQQGIAYYDSCMRYATINNNYICQATCTSLRAGIYGVFTDHVQCIDLYNKGLEMAQLSKDPKTIAILSNNLATAYQNSGLYLDKVIPLFSASKASFETTKDWKNAASISVNLASTYSDAKEFDNAKTEIKTALRYLYKDSSDRHATAEIYSALADCYVKLNMLDTALHFALQSNDILTQLKTPDNLMVTTGTLCKVYMLQKKWTIANATANKYLELAVQQGSKASQSTAYGYLATIAEAQANWQQASNYYKLQKIWNDSAFNMQQVDAIAQQETKIEFLKNELEAKYKNVTLQKKNSSLSKQIIWAILGSLLFIAIAIYSWLANVKNKKLNVLILQEKQIVEQQAKEKAVLISEIHHRVKNNLTMLKSLFYLQSKVVTDEGSKRILMETQNRIQSMALVHQQLYATDNAATLDLPIFIKDLVVELCGTYRNDAIAIEVIGTCKPIDIHLAIPLSIILNELTTNSIKYAFADSKQPAIAINIAQTNNVLQISYADNGPGLTEDFETFKGGFGFKVLRLLCNQIDGTIDYTNAKNDSRFKIELALKESNT